MKARAAPPLALPALLGAALAAVASPAAAQLPGLLADLNSTPQSSRVRILGGNGAFAFLAATRGGLGEELWRSDGTPAGLRAGDL